MVSAHGNINNTWYKIVPKHPIKRSTLWKTEKIYPMELTRTMKNCSGADLAFSQGGGGGDEKEFQKSRRFTVLIFLFFSLGRPRGGGG